MGATAKFLRDAGHIDDADDIAVLFAEESHLTSNHTEVDPPFLCLLASGGHTMLLDVRERGGFQVLGTTLDDAAGEAFDKGARLLGLGYPGGAAIDRLAREGDPAAFDFPVARVPGFDFSFSGLKTALLYATRDARRGETTRAGPTWPRATSARSCGRSSSGREAAAAEIGADRIAVVGGVAANSELRAALPGRRARTAAALHRQRGDDRLGREIRRGRPVSWLSCARCLRLSAAAAHAESSRSCSSRPSATAVLAFASSGGSGAGSRRAGRGLAVARPRRRRAADGRRRPARARRPERALARAARRARGRPGDRGRSGHGRRRPTPRSGSCSPSSRTHGLRLTSSTATRAS